MSTEQVFQLALLLLATSALVSILISAMVSSIMNGKRRQRERIEDLADRKIVSITLQEQTDRTVFWARSQGEQLQELRVQVKEVHTLVNSQLTESKESDLASARLTLFLANRIIDRDKRDGVEPGEEDLNIIRATQEKVKHLEAVLIDRAEKQAEVDASREPKEEVSN